MATEPMTGLMRVSRPLAAAMPSIPERISYYYWVDGILLNTDLSTPITPGNANFASAQSTFIGDNGDGASTVTYRLPTAMGSIPRQFLRVGYSYSE